VPGCRPIPEPLETHAAQFGGRFTRPSQRAAFCPNLTGLLLPAERNKTLQALANTKPVLQADPDTAPRTGCVLIVDETGDRKNGAKSRTAWCP
jgi:hypothetical protein